MINDYGAPKIESPSQDTNQDSSVGVMGVGINIGDNVDTYGGKPKILKDASKYVKKRNHKSQQPSTSNQQHSGNSNKTTGHPMNNIIQSVQEGLSQILNPAQTFLDPSAQNANQLQLKATGSANQTPTFQQQHMPKIGG